MSSNENGQSENPNYLTSSPQFSTKKWSRDEEQYAERIIRDFMGGILPGVSDGYSLRKYLSEKLGCSSMRITKHYSKTKCIGKTIFMAAPLGMFPKKLRDIADNELSVLRKKFLNKINAESNNTEQQQQQQMQQQMQIQQQQMQQQQKIERQQMLMKCLLKVVENARDKLLNSYAASAPAPAPAPASTKYKKKYKLNTPVRKNFPGHGWFDGNITGYNTRKEYIITYTDADKESYKESDPELKEIIINASNHKINLALEEKKQRDTNRDNRALKRESHYTVKKQSKVKKSVLKKKTQLVSKRKRKPVVEVKKESLSKEFANLGTLPKRRRKY